MAVVYILSFIGMIVTTAIVTASDPTDPTVALERFAKHTTQNKMTPQFEFSAKGFKFHCDICNTHVLKNTKHCQRCNRCCYEFDHHCVWVSNDIGLHNYAAFMRMLIAVFATVVTQLAFCIYVLLIIDHKVPDISEAQIGFVSRNKLRVLTIVTLTIVVILLLLVTYLLTYHAWLICHNTTTYKHIRQQQKRAASKSRVIREVENDKKYREGENKQDNEVEKKVARTRWKDIFCCSEKSNPLYLQRNNKTCIRVVQPKNMTQNTL